MSLRWFIIVIVTALTSGGYVASATGAEMVSNEGQTLEINVSMKGSGSSGDWAPYLLGSNTRGQHAMKGYAGIDGFAYADYDLGRRFSWTAGVEVAAAWQASASYKKYLAEEAEWIERNWHPSYATVYQLWGGVKFRGVMLWAGMRDRVSSIVDDRLSSGDVVLSTNARAIPRVEAGFVDFQNIPFTNGWAQINGCISYGKYTSNGSLEGRYNYWNSHITLGQLFAYKNIYFRSRQDMPLAVTIGVQVGGEYGGTTYWYSEGKQIRLIKNNANLRSLWEMFFPTSRYSDGFMEGNHVGSWDFLGRYRFKNNIELGAYFQWLWEDGSGMAKRNRTDGLWGLSLTMPGSYPALKKVIVEYIDFRDQSGPIHWAPSDAPGTTIGTEATGGDNDYNSSGFNAWSNYGLGLGSSFPKAPLYNSDGNIQFKHNRTHGVQIGAEGFISSKVEWLFKFSYGVAWGTGRIPYAVGLKNTSGLVEVSWHADKLLQGLSVGATMAFDSGSLRGDNVGGMLNIKYATSFDVGQDIRNKKKSKSIRQWKSIRYF
ncbi:MAG: hypothetical protein J1F20_02455 [Muribaculaceae bacterium]|nr:hypothetical protein [Muribaculaceae bacterium]